LEVEKEVEMESYEMRKLYVGRERYRGCACIIHILSTSRESIVADSQYRGLDWESDKANEGGRRTLRSKYCQRATPPAAHTLGAEQR
jgi:hypothetical protein